MTDTVHLVIFLLRFRKEVHLKTVIFLALNFSLIQLLRKTPAGKVLKTNCLFKINARIGFLGVVNIHLPLNLY